jgi:hypothetical protein
MKALTGLSWFDKLTTNGPFALSVSKGNGRSFASNGIYSSLVTHHS